MRLPIVVSAVVAVLGLAALSSACDKNDDLVIFDQLQNTQEGCPQGCTDPPPPNCKIKGNISAQGNKFYHVPGGQYYDGIVVQVDKGERWFCTEEEAAANGWRKSFN